MMHPKPVFPAPESSPGQQPSRQSSMSSLNPSGRKMNYIEQIAQAYNKIEALPNELCPPSRSPSPLSQSRADLLGKKVTEAVSYAGRNTTDQKWIHVARALRMACTSRMYRGIPQGVRVGETARARVELGTYEWVLPDTAEEWEECEKKWNSRLSGVPADRAQASKYWPQAMNPDELDNLDDDKSPSKAELVRDKVKAWQANVVHLTKVVDPEESSDTSAARGTRRGVAIPPKTRQSPITFPVAKASAQNVTAKPVKSRSPHDTSARTSYETPSSNSPQRVLDTARLSQPENVRITELSEMSFIPPSFAVQLDTSTPPNVEKARFAHKPRTKPPPILPLPRTDVSTQLPSPDRIAPPLLELSSLPQLTPSPGLLEKRTRSHSPSVNNGSSYALPEQPPPKKRRTDDTHPAATDPAPQPTTPPRSTAPPRTPSPFVSKGLGNAKGLLLPRTPDANGLPTLSDLLASSRRSRPRPRPPSRKTKSTVLTPAAGMRNAARDPSLLSDDLPVLPDTREPSPAPTIASRAKTVFSSPASGSSGSPQSVRERPRSPVSPLFPHSFAPPHVSTQNGPGAGGFGGMALSQAPGPDHGLERAGSGVFAMGYNSQFDLEGQVGAVNDILERDVDFDGWLRDIPEVDAEG